MKSISAVQLLRDDHKKILGLFRQLEVLGVRAPELRDAVVVELFEEFLIHSQLEERLFYPGVERLIQEKYENYKEKVRGRKLEGYPKDFKSEIESAVNESGLIERSFTDHQEVAVLIRQYFRERIENNVHDGSKLEEMSELVRAHMFEEEKNLFAFVEKYFSDQLEDMGQGLIALKKDLMRENRIPDASQPQHAQNPDGGEQRRIA